MIRRISLLLLPVLFSAVAVRAAETAPAPSSQAASTAPAPSWATPKDAFLTYLRATLGNDGVTMQKSVAWENPADGARMMQQLTGGQAAMREVYELLEKQYPDDPQVREVMKQGRFEIAMAEKGKAEMLGKMVAAVAEAEAKIEGDSATLAVMNSMTVKFKKVDARWLLLPESVGMAPAPRDEATRKQMEKAAAMQARISELMKQGYAAYVADLKARKFGTGKEAMDAMQKINQDVMKQVFAEENPTSVPARTPGQR
jgi:hypothetical protein